MAHSRNFLMMLSLLLLAGTASAQLIPLHYRVQAAFPTAGSATELEAAVTVRVRTAATTRVVNFTLAEGMKPGSVAIEGQTYRPARIGPGRYTLLMVNTWAAHTEHEMTFHYSGVPPAPDHVRRDDVLLTANSGWYPRFEGETSFTTEVDLHPPIGVQVVTRGELAQEDSTGLQTWIDDQSGSSLGLVWKRGLATEEFNQPGLQVQGVCPGLSPNACAQAVDAFGKRLFSDYEVFARRYQQPRRSRIVPLIIAEGIPSLQGGPRLYLAPPTDEWSPERQLALAASVSQLWWHLDSTAPQDAWLRAGLPLISALAAIRHEQGASGTTACLKWLQETARAGNTALRPAAQDDPAPAAEAQPATAARAALVLNALRLFIGNDDFEEAVAIFQKAARQHPEAATTGAFEKTAAAVSHMNLDWFWSQWLERPDLPQIEFAWRVVRLPRSGQTVRVQLRQQGKSFGFRAPIVIVAGGKRYVQSIEVHNADTILGIPVKGKLDTVEFDPDQQLLRAAMAAPSADPPPAAHAEPTRKPAKRKRSHTLTQGKARQAEAPAPPGPLPAPAR